MSGISQRMEYDVTVIGCGTAGLSAGIAAAEAGSSVLVLEKAPEEMRGGNSRYVTGTRAPTAELKLDLEFHRPDYTSADFYQDVMRVTNGQADAELLQTLTKNTASAVDWIAEHLDRQGFGFQETKPKGQWLTGRVYYGDPVQFIGKLVEAAEAEGAEFLYNAEARRLVQGGSSRVEGVVADIDGTLTEIQSGAVVIACGGFESNTQKRAQYLGNSYDKMKVRGVRYNTGEALDMALDVGADSAGHWSAAHIVLIDAQTPDVEGGQTFPHGYQYGIIVNHDGERFVDEGEDARENTYAKFGSDVFEQPYQEAFLIADADIVELIDHVGPSEPMSADSIEDLVNRLDIENADRAVGTVTEYNEACPGGVEITPDTLDGVATSDIQPPKSNWATPIEEPPFFGFPLTGGITFTFGGLATSTDARVLDTSRDPIPGLYVAGNASGGIFYENYPGGAAQAKAMVFGRIAGDHAADFVESGPA